MQNILPIYKKINFYKTFQARLKIRIFSLKSLQNLRPSANIAQALKVPKSINLTSLIKV